MSDSQNPEQQLQSILSNVSVGGSLTTGDITQIFKIFVNLDQIPKPQGIPQNIASSSTDKFVGRERDLENLNQQLQRNNQVVIAAVEGMGGVGKTELAIQYSLLNLQLDTYPGGICWISAREQDIGLQIVNFARTDLDLNPPDDLELPDRVRWCWKRWQKGNTLIVLDDVKDYSDIKSYLPPQPSQFKVLITTRLKLDLPSSLYLEVLSEADALELLSQLVGGEKVKQELETAKELCQRLGYLPLALQLVGRYVKKRRISLFEELRRLEEKGLGHPSMEVPKNDPSWTLDIKRGVEAAFELSWEDLKESELAQELGCLLSLFALAPIPWELVESAAVEHNVEELEDARVELENLHLLQGGDSYQLHQLIQEFFRDKQNKLVNADNQKKNFVAQIVYRANKINKTASLLKVSFSNSLIPHLEKVVLNFQEYLEDEVLAQPFKAISRFYEFKGLYIKASHWLEECISCEKQRLGKEHYSKHLTEVYLARIYYLQGRYKDSEFLFSRAFNLFQQLRLEECVNFATILSGLGCIYKDRGEYDKAETFALEALEINVQLKGENDPELAHIINNLAAIYDCQERYEEAEQLYLKALNFFQEVEGDENLPKATYLSNLASHYSSLGRYKDALPLLIEALEINKNIFGENHPEVATGISYLGDLYHSLGRFNEAEAFLIKGLKSCQKLLGENHPDSIRSLGYLANLYSSLGRYSEAEALLLRSIELKTITLGEENLSVADGFESLSSIYALQGRLDEAIAVCIKSLTIKRKLLGEENLSVASILNSIGECYYFQKKYLMAEKNFQQSFELRQKIVKEDHQDYLTSLNNLAAVYCQQKKYDKAEPLHLKALESRIKILGVDHPHVALSLNNLGDLYCSQKRYSEAVPILEKAIEIRRKLLGEEHPDVAMSYNNLGQVYQSQEKYDEAEVLLKKAFEIAKRTLGLYHHYTMLYFNNYIYLKNLVNKH